MINEIQRFITIVAEGGHLSRQDAGRAFQIIMLGAATPAQIAALLVALRYNKENADEISGAAEAMRVKMETVQAPVGTIDVCGTGGDGKGSLNVSTATAFVVAGAGVPVAKHGNKSVSSRSGSADVLSALGVNIQANKEVMERALRETNIGFFFAPLYHKAMRHVAPVRQELGLRTIFNLLGPLANPAKPQHQLLGVYDKALLLPMAEVLRNLGLSRAWVVHSSDGMDELSLNGTTHVAELKDGDIRLFDVSPLDAGLDESQESIRGKGPDANAVELQKLLGGKASAYRDTVILNAAAALLIAGKAASLKEGAALAAQAIDSGKADQALHALVRITHE